MTTAEALGELSRRLVEADEASAALLTAYGYSRGEEGWYSAEGGEMSAGEALKHREGRRDTPWCRALKGKADAKGLKRGPSKPSRPSSRTPHRVGLSRSETVRDGLGERGAWIVLRAYFRGVTGYLSLLIGSTTEEGGHACFLFARDDRRVLGVGSGDQLIIELEEVPSKQEWRFGELPPGFAIRYDGYITDHTWTKGGKRRRKGHEDTPAERRFVLDVTPEATPGPIALEKLEGGVVSASWRVEIDDTATPVISQRRAAPRSLDEGPTASPDVLAPGRRSRLSSLSELAAR